jgi:hypothetical protein
MPTLIDFPAFIPYKWFMTERQDSIVDPTKLTCFTCRLCRSALFSDKDLEPHATGAQRINRRKVRITSYLRLFSLCHAFLSYKAFYVVFEAGWKKHGCLYCTHSGVHVLLLK